jgi:hypothetical protein
MVRRATGGAQLYCWAKFWVGVFARSAPFARKAAGAVALFRRPATVARDAHEDQDLGHQHHRLYHRRPDRDRNAGVDPAALTPTGIYDPFCCSPLNVGGGIRVRPLPLRVRQQSRCPQQGVCMDSAEVLVILGVATFIDAATPNSQKSPFATASLLPSLKRLLWRVAHGASRHTASTTAFDHV